MRKATTRILAYLTVGLLLTVLTSMGKSSGDPAHAGQTIDASTEASAKVDSLKTVIATADHTCPEPCRGDTTKVKAMQKLAWELKYFRPDSAATILCKKALELLENDNLQGESGNNTPLAYSSLRADVFNTLGVVNRIQSNYPPALDYYFKSLKIREELGNAPEEATAKAGKKGMAAS